MIVAAVALYLVGVPITAVAVAWWWTWVDPDRPDDQFLVALFSLLWPLFWPFVLVVHVFSGVFSELVVPGLKWFGRVTARGARLVDRVLAQDRGRRGRKP